MCILGFFILYFLFFNFSGDTRHRGNEFHCREIRATGKGGGGGWDWAGFHFALFMSQDKASRVREELRVKRRGSSLVCLMYDKCT